MPGLITIRAARSNFFDRQSIVTAAGAARVKVLSRFGAFVRQRAKTSIRKRKKASKAGSPPSSHNGLLRQFLFFSYDRERGSVVVGPALINRPTGAPETLEYGGDTTIEEHRFVSGPKYGNRARYLTEHKKIHVQPRPFMGPALAAELPGLPAMWQDSIR